MIIYVFIRLAVVQPQYCCFSKVHQSVRYDLVLSVKGVDCEAEAVVLWQAWERLEKAEHERELALRTELIRQEKLEQLARRFDRKAAMRETWLSENQRLVSQVHFTVLQTHMHCIVEYISDRIWWYFLTPGGQILSQFLYNIFKK